MTSMRAMEPRGRSADTPREPLDFGGRAVGDMDALEDFARALGARSATGEPGSAAGLLSRRVNTDERTVEKDLAKLVLTLVDLVRRLMERQAIRRVNAGSLTEDEVERMGETFLRLEQRMTELRTAFGLAPEDLNLNLGPLGDLL